MPVELYAALMQGVLLWLQPLRRLVKIFYNVLTIILLFKAFQDYTTPPERELCRDLEATINPYIRFVP